MIFVFHFETPPWKNTRYHLYIKQQPRENGACRYYGEKLCKDDSIFVNTDGFAEATDANNQLFGTDRTLEALNSISAGSAQKDVLSGVRAAVDAFVKEAPQFDDLTMLALRYNGPAETGDK